MNMTSQSDSQNNKVDKVLEKISEIVQHSASGNYIYRGEHQSYEKVSSNLYRAYADLGIKNSDVIRQGQKKSSKAARGYLNKTADETPLVYLDDVTEDISENQPGILRAIDEKRDFEILARIQHYGGKTNLIDFTTDYLIALFFACLGSEEEDGRVILLKNKDKRAEYKIKKMSPLISRAESQKSIFVEPYKGFVDLTEHNSYTISIPKCLKKAVLDYLRDYHDISTESIYNDLHGFIRLQDIYLPIYKALYEANEWETRGDSAEKDSEKQRCYGESVKIYAEILRHEPKPSEVYGLLGKVYAKMGEYDKAIGLNSKEPEYYFNRGSAYLQKGDVELAKTDYREAIRLDRENIMYRRDLCLTLFKSQEWEEADKELSFIKDMGKLEDIDTLLKELEAAKHCERCKIHLEKNEWRKASEELKVLEKMEHFNIRPSLQEIKEFVKNEEINLPGDLAAMLENC